MKKNRFLSTLLLLLILSSLFTPSVLALEPLELECANAILVDANHNEILHEKSAYDKAYYFASSFVDEDNIKDYVDLMAKNDEKIKTL